MITDRLDVVIAAVTFAVAFIALYIGHWVGDHVVQRQSQCENKGGPGWTGRIACAAHVATYTVTQAVFLAAAILVLGFEARPAALTTGFAVSAITHYIADRRTPLKKMATAAGKSEFYALGEPRPDHDDNPVLGTGAYALDQTWHRMWLFAAALLMAVVPA